MNVYSSDDYRKILVTSLEEKKFLDKKYTYQLMADHMRIQKPYISKVINNRADFSSDQLYMACDFLGFGEDEKNYMLLLLELERTTYTERKKSLKKQIETILDVKRGRLRNKKKLSEMSIEEFSSSQYMDYYLDPNNLLVHIFLTIKRFRENKNLICEELNISKDYLSEILIKLDNLGLIEVKRDQIKVLVRSMHLPKQSDITSSHHQLLHHMCILRKKRLSVEQKVSFCVTFASDKKTKQKIKKEFGIFMDKIKDLAMNSPAKDCYQLNFDMFPWSSGEAD